MKDYRPMTKDEGPKISLETPSSRSVRRARKEVKVFL